MNSQFRHIATALLAAAFILSGCSGDGPVGPGDRPIPESIVWNQVHGGLGVGTIHAIWGITRDNVYATSDLGIVHFDGSRWRAEAAAFPDSLRAVWGAAGVVFAGGPGGTLLRRVNGDWNDDSGITQRDIRGIHGTSATSVFAVAATPGTTGGAELLHYDGTTWAHLDTHDGVSGNAVFATVDTVYVACDDGVILRYTGSGLVEVVTPVGDDLLGVWGASASDVHAVGRDGHIIHWNGNTWTAEASPVTADVYAVSGNAADNFMAVGDQGTLLHFDGTAWATAPAGTSIPLRGACVFGDGRAMACGIRGSVLSGYADLLAADYLGEPFDYEAVWSWEDDYFIVGSSSDGTGSITGSSGPWYTPEGLHAVTGFAPYNVIAAGDSGAIYQFDGDSWLKQTTPITFTVRALTSLLTRNGNPYRAYAVGDDGGLAVWKVNAWYLVTPPAGTQTCRFVDVWAAALDDVFAVADNTSSIVRYDDPTEQASWTVENTPATAPLLAVGGLRGDVYIASAAGEIFLNQGDGWQTVPSPVTTPLRDIRGTGDIGDSALFAVGDRGVILYGDGQTWRKLDSPFFGTLLGVWGEKNRTSYAVGTLYAVGVDGAILTHGN